MRRIACAFALLLLPIAGVTLSPGRAFAHGQMEEPTVEPVAQPPPSAHLERTHLMLRLPDDAVLGDRVTIAAVLTDRHRMPVRGATVVFVQDAIWGEELAGHMVIGIATTDRKGVATITEQLRSSGEIEVGAEFPGDAEHRATETEATFAVEGDIQLYSPSVGIRVPWLNLWVLAGVILLVWGLFVVVGARIVAIARAGRSIEGAVESAAGSGGTSRRQFLRGLLPYGAQAAVATVGLGLVALVARSPRTHGNLMAPPSTETYRRTPVAFVGSHMEMREIPETLDREVSFSKEVLPIFRAFGGPHVVAPRNSPPPGALRLDSYEHVMEKEGVIVPGEPEMSELVEHLLSPAMQMPPSVPPLPDEQIRLIVTWIAQGAKDN